MQYHFWKVHMCPFWKSIIHWFTWYIGWVMIWNILELFYDSDSKLTWNVQPRQKNWEYSFVDRRPAKIFTEPNSKFMIINLCMVPNTSEMINRGMIHAFRTSQLMCRNSRNLRWHFSLMPIWEHFSRNRSLISSTQAYPTWKQKSLIS